MLPLNCTAGSRNPIAIPVVMRKPRASELHLRTLERQNGRGWVTELLPRSPSGTAREPKIDGANSAVRDGGDHPGSKRRPPQLAVTPPVLISLCRNTGCRFSSSRSRACQLDIVLMLRLPAAEEVGDG